ncbi:MAG: hypothetical protein M3Q71_11140 [Chloroflexota bacterium]|nr:hypothetical protein [Chloroflexota bacterium]
MCRSTVVQRAWSTDRDDLPIGEGALNLLGVDREFLTVRTAEGHLRETERIPTQVGAPGWM